MYGETHSAIGLLYYCIFACIVSGLGFSALGFGQITLAGIIFSALGGAFPDIDYEYGTIRTSNPIYKFFKRYYILALIFFIYFAYLAIVVVYTPIWFFSYENLLEELKVADPNEFAHFIISYLFHFAILFVSIIFRKHLKTRVIPILLVLIIYNNVLPQRSADWGSFIVLVFIFTASIFPHRTFTHSIEGFVCYSLAATYLAAKSGFLYIGFCFTLGYFTHLWLSDILTNSGIHMSYFVHLLGKKGVISKESTLYRILGKMRSFHLMTVGSERGHFIEKVYVEVALAIASIIVFATLPNFALI